MNMYILSGLKSELTKTAQAPEEWSAHLNDTLENVNKHLGTKIDSTQVKQYAKQNKIDSNSTEVQNMAKQITGDKTLENIGKVGIGVGTGVGAAYAVKKLLTKYKPSALPTSTSLPSNLPPTSEDIRIREKNKQMALGKKYNPLTEEPILDANQRYTKYMESQKSLKSVSEYPPSFDRFPKFIKSTGATVSKVLPLFGVLPGLVSAIKKGIKGEGLVPTRTYQQNRSDMRETKDPEEAYKFLENLKQMSGESNVLYPGIEEQYGSQTRI